MRSAFGRKTGLTAAAVFAVSLGAATAALGQDQLSVERPGSILIFPKVINADGMDTVIQITNASNMASAVQCFYLDGQPLNGTPRCQSFDFELNLTRQQPTHWQVSEGRTVNPTDNLGGLDPGIVPPVPPGFTGGLVCVAVDAPGGAPIGTDNLRGVATIAGTGGTAGTAIQQYNAIAIPAVGTNDPPANALELDDGEYARCPDGFQFAFEADGGPDAAIDALGTGPSAISGALTIMPCTMDFENALPAQVTLNFTGRNEFEELISLDASVDLSCWGTVNLADIPAATIGGAGSPTAWFRVTPAPGDVGVVAVQATARQDGAGNVAMDANSVHHIFETDPAAQVPNSTITVH